MKFFLFLLASIITLNSIFAQTDSIQNEIKSLPDSEFETILKSRRLISYSLDSGDYDKIKQIRSFLTDHETVQENVTFSITEYWLILYWTQEYEELLKSISDIGLKTNSRDYTNVGQRTFQYGDQLYEQLMLKSNESKEILALSIENSTLSQEEKDFLSLHLSYCLSESSSGSNIQDSLNVLSDEYLATFPYSVYGPFVKKIIRIREKVSDFAFGYDLYIGYNQFERNIAQSMDNCGSFGLSFDFLYKNLFLDFSLSIAYSKLKHDVLSQSLLWQSGMDASVFMSQLQLGYTFFDKKRINFSPLIGLSFIEFSPIFEDTQTYAYLENLYFDSKISWSAGFSINLSSKPSWPVHFSTRARRFQLYTQIKYIYSNLEFIQNSSDFNGGLHQVILTFGVLSRRINRIY